MAGDLRRFNAAATDFLAATPPVPSGQTVTFTLGSRATALSCNGTANTSGLVTCTIAAVNQPLGPNSVSASFAGDSSYYLPSTASEPVILFAFLAQGSMIVGNLDSSSGTAVEFWGAQSCGGGWTIARTRGDRHCGWRVLSLVRFRAGAGDQIAGPTLTHPEDGTVGYSENGSLAASAQFAFLAPRDRAEFGPMVTATGRKIAPGITT